MKATQLIQKISTRHAKKEDLKDFYFKYELYNDSSYRYQWIAGCVNEASARWELRARNAYLAGDKVHPLSVLRNIIKVDEKQSMLSK